MRLYLYLLILASKYVRQSRYQLLSLLRLHQVSINSDQQESWSFLKSISFQLNQKQLKPTLILSYKYELPKLIEAITKMLNGLLTIIDQLFFYILVQLYDNLMTIKTIKSSSKCLIYYSTMQAEHWSPNVSVSFLGADNQLMNLFNSTDDQKNSSYFQLNNEPVNLKNLFNNLQIKESQIQKGYASDESPEKRQRNKKIKKRKHVVYHKMQSLKDRATTKFYIQSLQNRILQLKMQVERLQKLNKVNIEYIKKINDSELIMNCFFQHRQKIMQKLQKLTNAENPNNIKIETECSALLKKQGSYGEDRIKAIQYYFKQLVSMMTTNCHKYMAEAALKNSDLFNPASIDTWQGWRKQLFLKLNLSPRVLAQFSQKREEILGLHRQFNEKLLEMYKQKCILLQLSREIETHYDEMGRQLTPLQKGRLVCFLQKYKFEGHVYNEQPICKMYLQLSDQKKFTYEDEGTKVVS